MPDPSIPIFDILYSHVNTHSLILANELGVFTFIGSESKSLEQIAQKLNLHPRPVAALLSMCVSLGLLNHQKGIYTLTTKAKDCLLPQGRFFWGDMIAPYGKFPKQLSYEAFKNSILTNKPIADALEPLDKNPRAARGMTKAMHSKSLESSYCWPQVVNFDKHKVMLDIGGGSGVHSMGMVSKWPHMQSIVYDFRLVCEIAEEFVKERNLQSKVSTCAGDMWNQKFPKADVHFYSDVFHDWSFAKDEFLTKKSFESLDDNGVIVVHEILFHDDKNGPWPAAVYDLTMLTQTTGGGQLSQSQLHRMLSKAGFEDIKTIPTGYASYSVTVGTKLNKTEKPVSRL